MGRSTGGRREVESLLCAAEAAGCKVTGGGSRHFKVLAPGGKGIVVVACSPSDRRAMANTRGRLRRLGVELPR